MANGLEAIGRALQGFGAGVAGQGPQFIAGLQQQQQQLDANRRTALLQDAFTIQQHILNDNLPGVQGVLQDRLNAVQQLGGNPDTTLDMINKLNTGDIQGLLADVTAPVEFAKARGILNPSEPFMEIDKKTGQVITKRGGEFVAEPIRGFRRDAGGERDRELRERQLAIQEAAERRQATKLSAGLEKALLTAQDRTVEAQRNANEFDVLAGDFERLNLAGGIKSTVSETFKSILGTQDDVTEFRRRFNKVRLSEGLKNLPPGPATDRDVKEAFKGVPKENASAQQVSSFLRGAARLARFEAGFNQFKSDFISGKRTGAGLNKTWRKQVISPALNRSVSVAEIYETAQNRGISPEEVIQQLGITEGSF
jgi:hypothetical protein